MSDSKPQYLSALEDDSDAIAALHEAGCITIFDICRHTELTFIEKVPTLTSAQAKQIYAYAQERSQCLLSLYRAYQARNEPLMRRIAKLGITSTPAALGHALERSLGGAPDFADLFPERSDDGYVDAESIQSLFSPARYLVELYKIAEGLHTANSPLNLNARRPDIAALVLNEENLTQEVSTLNILIDVLQQGIQSATGVSMTDLERIYYPMTLPYHDNLVQIRSVLSSKNSSLQQAWAVLVDYQAQQFQPLAGIATPARKNIQTPAPAAREEILLTPATFELLAAPPASAEIIQNHYHLPTTNIAEELKSSSVFLDRTGLTFNQLVSMTGQADYETSDPAALKISRFYRFGATEAVPVANYGQFYLALHGGSGPTPLLLGPGQDEPELQLSAADAVVLADRAERLIRLQPLVQLEFHQLDWLIRNANRAYSQARGDAPLLDKPILEVLAEFMRLRDAYSLSSDAYTCFIGEMNTFAPENQASLYEQLFTSPTEGNTLPLNVTLNFDPAVPSDEQALLCGGLGVSADQLFVMAKLAFTDTAAVVMNPERFAQLYRQAMIPNMLGITFDQARLLWRMLNPQRDIAALVAGPATLEVLNVIRQTETVVQWLRDHQMPLEEAFSLITDRYSDSVTPELFNFTDNIYTSLSTDLAAMHYQVGTMLPDDLRQKLYRLNASVFKVKANVMGRLIGWLDQHFTSKADAFSQASMPYGLGHFWSDIGALFSAQKANPLDEMGTTSDVARYSHAMAQYALIVQWANLTEQDLALIVDKPARFMGAGGEELTLAPPPSLEVLLFISRLKEWQQRVIVPEAEAMTYFELANRSGQTAEVALTFLAYLQGWDKQATTDMNANLVQEQLYTDFPKSFAQVLQLEAWMQVGHQVGSQCVQGLYRMSLEQAEAEDSTLIQSVAEVLVASLRKEHIMTMQAALADIQEARRNALVDYYIAHCVPDTLIDGGVPLSERVKTQDDLYEYLLIDTQITAVVTTSQVAEAISSVQLYVNRCLGGYDPDVDNAPGSTMVVESKPGGFLYDWDAYNQVYSTWAGKERLQYYPSVYLDPSLRYNKTELFNVLEETINQGRISSTRVDAGFQQYMLGFETIADLETISGYQAGIDSTEDCKDTLYFIGRTPTEPYSYYWRSCNMAVRDDQGNITGGAWSQWLKVGVPGAEALDGYLSPCWANGRLSVSFLSRVESGATGTDNKTPTYQYYFNIWTLREDGGWAATSKLSCTAPGVPERAIAVASPNEESLSLYLLTTTGFFSKQSSNWVKVDTPAPSIDLILKPEVYEFNTEQLNMELVGRPVLLRAPDGRSSIVKVVELYAAQPSPVIGFLLEGEISGFVQFYGMAGSEVATGMGLDPGAIRRTGVYESLSFDFMLQALEAEPSEMFYIYIREPVFSSGGFNFDRHALFLTGQSGIFWSLPLSTSSAKYFTNHLQSGLSRLLSYQTQTALIEQNGTEPIDFNGSYGLYFWEIFFHGCFLIADRYLNEQNYADAAQWYRYIFAATGYRNAQGELETVGGLERYWNVVPLQQDHTWNKAIPPTDDPDVIAMNDPMHYKMAIFLNTINQLIEQGDSVYRMLQRDYLVQAKMCYLQASQLLGPRPVIDYNASWPNPTVATEAQEIVVLDSDAPDPAEPTYLTTALRAFLAEQNGNFLPPYNADLLAYWDKLEIRFYNLRHNLSLDGQPLSLPLYADPVSPTELQRRHGTGNGAGGNSVSNSGLISQFRFPVLLEKARVAVNSVMQFGASLQGVLDRRDNENMTLLLQTQQQQVLAMTQEIHNNNIAVLQDGLMALQSSLKGAQTRLSHYSNLYSNWISSSEQTAMDLRTTAAALNIASQPLHTTAAGLEMVPNIFGFACGGTKYGAVATAVGMGLQIGAMVSDLAAQRLDISEQYRRRREDWQIQRDTAASEVAQLEAQIQSQTQQIAMAQKQMTLAKQELANQQAVYDLQTTRFTGLELFNWMTGRLSSLYYQLYDVTLSLCLSCKAALVREIGAGRAGNLFVAPMWNDLYQGLLAGEGLLLELQRMENTYLKDDKRGLEILKTVSLNAQITEADSNASFDAMLSAVLAGESPTAQGGVAMTMSGADKLVISLQVNTLELRSAYGTNGKTGRLKNISVTLPALLGPYQDVEATLGLGATYVALSRGLDDSGVFVVDFNDPKYLPFEGDPVDSGTLILTFYRAGLGGKQRRLVESLVDVIYQIRYTLKDY